MFLYAVAKTPTGLTAVQEGPTSIRVSWTPSSGATGYRIDYTSSDDTSGNVTVSGGSTDNYLLTGLTNGDTYTISIVATSEQSASDPSDSVDVRLTETGQIIVITKVSPINYVPLCQMVEEGMEGEMEGGVVEEIEVEEGELMEVQWLLVFLYLSSF